MRVLTEAIIARLRKLPARDDARRMVSVIPLGSIYWDDEMPDYLDLAKLSEDERNAMWRLFGIRFKIWDGEVLSTDDQAFWDAARKDVPTWALFHRLALSADDRDACKQAEGDIEKEFEAFFGDADQVELTDKGQGLKEFSATFDLTKKPNTEQ
ncbi:MAG TPA: hypothetical protein VNY05_27870 [Candidatus Acidoferrales bacterium]|jgi:hypothetical protein|nr:hypothetical protein [Candidatus Acidoferrales bacterium]